jgi:hypothetical protein
MAEESEEQGDNNKSQESSRDETNTVEESEDAAESEAEDDEDDEVEDEPKLKYARLTSNLLPVYRNGDATSAFMVAGDKMVGLFCGEHPGFC